MAGLGQSAGGAQQRTAALPIAALAPGWRTRRTERSVLLVVHSATAAVRLRDILPAFRDRRLHLFATRTDSGVFSAGVDELLSSAGANPIPWAEARQRTFHLAVTASLGDELHALNCPILRIPHGNGYNKYWNKNGERRTANGERRTANGERRTANGERRTANGAVPAAPSASAAAAGHQPAPAGSVFGLSADTLIHDGRVVPAAIALSHTEQFDRLASGCPPALDRAFLAGDPCHDRILASLPHRRAYRAAFGLRPGQQLLLINSTWREESLFGSHPDLIDRALAELPIDEYTVALALHPNIWSAHSPLQIREWLHDARRSGLILLPPHEGWRAAAAAADCAISDSGSVGMYAAAAGVPVLFTPEGGSLDPASGLGRLRDTAALLDPGAPLLPQLAEARQRREKTTAVAAAWATSAPWESLDLIRAAAYRLLGLDEPAQPPALTAVTADVPRAAPPTAVRVAVRPVPGAPGELRVQRYPDAVAARGAASRAARLGPAALAVSDTERDHRIAAQADIIRLDAPLLPGRAAPHFGAGDADSAGGAGAGAANDTDGTAHRPAERSAEVFADRPGAALTLEHGRRCAVLRSRSGAAARVTADRGLAPGDADLVFTVLAERAIVLEAGAEAVPAGQSPRSATRDLCSALAALSPLRLRIGAARTVQVDFTAEPADGPRG